MRLSGPLRLISDKRGNIATMSAIVLPFAVGFCAFAIDVGSLYAEKRQVQAMVDVAAIAGSASPGSPNSAVLASLLRNGSRSPVAAGASFDTLPSVLDKDIVSIVPGRYDADSSRPTGQRFVPGATDANAVRVTLKREGTRHFGELFMPPPTISASAIAASTPRAAFAVGSRLAAVDGGLLNRLLGALLGSQVSLSVMDYNALLNADVSLFGFLDALAGRLSLTAGTYDDVLAAEASVGRIAAALAVTRGVDGTAKAALQALAAGASANTVVMLKSLIDLGDAGRARIGSGAGAVEAVANVMELLSASAMLANGKNQVAVDLGATIPGLAATTVKLAIGEPMQHSGWFAVGERGKIIRTAQTRLALNVQVGGTGLLAGIAVRLPLYLELAYAEAKLKRISCPSGGASSVTVTTKPGVAELRIATIPSTGLADFTRKPTFQTASIVDAPLIKIKGAAHVDIGNMQATDLSFSAADIRNRTLKTVSSKDLTTSLTQSLISDLDLEISVIGLGIGLPGAVKAALMATLAPVTPVIDALVDNLLTALGVKVGQADVRVTAVSCGRPVLVQ